jgi:hypothetical protein
MLVKLDALFDMKGDCFNGQWGHGYSMILGFNKSNCKATYVTLYK